MTQWIPYGPVGDMMSSFILKKGIIIKPTRHPMTLQEDHFFMPQRKKTALYMHHYAGHTDHREATAT